MLNGPIEQQTQLLNGGGGFVYESGTTPTTGPFCKIKVITAATFSAIDNSHAEGDALTSVSFPVGTVIPGLTNTFTLSAGSVFAYRNSGL